MADTNPLFFYGTGKKYGEFSQWYHAKFTVSKGEIYSVVGLPTKTLERPDEPVNFMTAEQCMMYCKAMRFGDLGTADKILLTPEPRKQKALGRQVKGFTEAGWDTVKLDVVQLANVAKFGQNEELQALLLGTGDRELVEAATNDRIWGIGMDEKQGRATMDTRENWGDNLLGKALVRARAHIRSIDIEELFSRKLDGCDSSFVMDLGEISALETSSCPLCRIFASFAPCSPPEEWRFSALASNLWEDEYYHLRIFSGCYVFSGRASRSSDRKMRETNLLGVAPSQSSHLALDRLTIDVIRDACAQNGFLGQETAANVQSVCKIRPVNPWAFNLTLVKRWISYCQGNHKTHCMAGTSSELRHFRVFDCHRRQVVNAPRRGRYVALSYVRGKTDGLTSSAPRVSPGTDGSPFEKVIEDSITVTKALGLRYLWVDKICIDHSDHDDTRHQIRQMDLIYANSYITIIAAACNTPDDGLPGIDGTPRANQQRLRINNTALIYTLPSGRSSVEKSKWYTRGWTFQEGILSTKRLIFTKAQVFFDCNGMHCSEAVDMPLDELHSREKYRFDTFAYELGPLAMKTPQPDMKGYMDYVQSFSMKELTYASDALDAFQGILNAFKRAKKPIYHFWGIPLFMSDSSLRQTTKQTRSMGSISARFTLCLFWRGFSKSTCSRSKSSWRTEELPPSWSWVGWNGGIAKPFASMGKDCFSDVEIWLEGKDGKLVNLNDVNFHRRMRALQDDYSSIFQLEAWTMPVEIKYRRVQESECTNQSVDREVQYAYFVTFQMGSQGIVYSKLMASGWNGTTSSTTFMALLPRAYTEDENICMDETAMVLKKVDRHYERVGLFKMRLGWERDKRGIKRLNISNKSWSEVSQGLNITLKRFRLG
ncbi:unnamed protein product [Clonostachys rosea]|uniref:NADAR domain-containing protein n=1 Tax=Bionectria ochroleuca TaxID=29856 RepID=A0ABY6UAV0_BIOOC|nr:unnamed protein product [Clonostachys rosea]